MVGKRTNSFLSLTVAASLTAAPLLVSAPTKVSADGVGKGLAIGAGIAIIANELNKASKKGSKNKSSTSVSTAPRATIGTFKTTKSEVRDYQMRLNRLGYDTGYPDGVVGANTRKGVKMFQARLQAEQTGTLSEAQAVELKRLTDLDGTASTATTVAAATQVTNTTQTSLPFANGSTQVDEDVLAVNSAIPLPPSLKSSVPQEQVSLQSAGTSATTLDVFVLDETPGIPMTSIAPNSYDILEVRPGDSMEAAMHVLGTQGVSGCQSVGDTTLCSMPSGASDQIALRAINDAAGVRRVAAIARHLHFDVPQPKTLLTGALQESYGDLMNEALHTVGAPGCAESVGSDSYTGAQIYEASVQSDMSVLGQVAEQCGTFARLTMEGPEESVVRDLYIVLFDGSHIPTVSRPASLATIKF